jgi:hypothetical protein
MFWIIEPKTANLRHALPVTDSVLCTFSIGVLARTVNHAKQPHHA